MIRGGRIELTLFGIPSSTRSRASRIRFSVAASSHCGADMRVREMWGQPVPNPRIGR